jgi:hypothetical protein
MSFDLFLVTFRNGGKVTADAAAARGVLERSRCDHRAEFDAYDFSFEDGSHVELYASGLHGGDKPFDGGMFALRGFSNAIASFIFEFSRAAGCVIFPAMEPACVFVPREDLAAHLPRDLGEGFQRIPVASGGELLAALNGGYEAWRAYRDHVVSSSGGDPDGAT